MSVGSPKSKLHYKKFECDGINVYVDKKAKVTEDMEISLRGIAFFKELQVSGIKA
ncbi:MAG: hypothetical protein H0Z35_11715 [Thermoanaerobacteraceae bacterium]|nr:hypothetical protein [Thermoanaerobacteraceae bacterium]